MLGEGLICQNDREKALKKLQSLRAINPVTCSEQALSRRREEFVENFISLAWKVFGVSKQSLKGLSEEELYQTAGLIYEKTKSHVRKKILSFAWIPIFGWLTLLGDEYLSYNLDYRFLKKAYGENFFPFDEFKRLVDLAY